MKTTWWHRATEAQKLTQIDAALELGVNFAALARNLGTTPGNVYAFARRHGRRFISLRRSEQCYVSAKKRRVRDLQRAYWLGEPVDFWSA